MYKWFKNEWIAISLKSISGITSLSLQAQCLINVSGDAVIFVRESELEAAAVQLSTAGSQTMNAKGDVTTWSYKMGFNQTWRSLQSIG